jgi:peroxiredoxin
MLFLLNRARPVLVGALKALVLACAFSRGAWASPPAAGSPAPSFTLKSIDGKDFALGALGGKIVLLHFWTTWCPECRREMPLLEEFSRARGKDVVILGINLAEKEADVAGYARDSKLTFPILLDPRGNVAAAYGVLGLPSTVVVDRKGRIAETVAMGSLTRERLDALVDRQAAGEDARREAHPSPSSHP